MRRKWKKNLKKEAKNTNEQMSIILDFLDKHRVVTGKCHPLVPREFECKWDELVDLLNAVENGSRKDKKQWKNFLYEWKCKTKKKTRLLKDSLKKIGGGGFSSSELTDLEDRLLSILGWISVVGCPDLPEEIDPDIPITDSDDQLNAVDVDMSDTFNLQNDSCESIEIIRIETASATADTSELPYANPAPGSIKKKSKPQEKRKEKVNAIQASTEMYCTSTNEMALAVKQMAEAISQLADALKYLAMGLGEMKTKMQNINNGMTNK